MLQNFLKASDDSTGWATGEKFSKILSSMCEENVLVPVEGGKQIYYKLARKNAVNHEYSTGYSPKKTIAKKEGKASKSKTKANKKTVRPAHQENAAPSEEDV